MSHIYSRKVRNEPLDVCVWAVRKDYNVYKLASSVLFTVGARARIHRVETSLEPSVVTCLFALARCGEKTEVTCSREG